MAVAIKVFAAGALAQMQYFMALGCAFTAVLPNWKRFNQFSSFLSSL